MKPRQLVDFIDLATGHLERHRIDTARLDAELLLAHLLGVDRLTLYVQFDKPLNKDETDQYREMIARRAKGEPVAYITGQKEFYSLAIKTDQRALIPRPDTEILVEEVLNELEIRFSEDDPLDVADVGTGSGAIAIALAKSAPRIRVTAVDIDQNAATLAHENVMLHDVSNQVTVVRGDLLEPLTGRRIHAIVSNPPYIAEGEWDELDPGVRTYEPKRALLGGADGLDYMRRLIDGSGRLLHPHGFLALEIGHVQGDAVRQLALAAGFIDVRIQQDLAGRDRVVLIGNNKG